MSVSRNLLTNVYFPSLNVMEVGRADDHGVDVVVVEELFVVAQELDGFPVVGDGLAS